MNPWMAIVGAALGAVKGRDDEDRANKMNRLAALMMRYSPWTGKTQDMVQSPSPWNAIMQGTSAGIGMGQNMGEYNMGMQERQAALNQQQKPQNVKGMGGY